MITIRPAIPTDCESIASVDVAAHWESYRDLLPESAFENATVPIRSKKWKEILTGPDLISVYVADQGGGLVGYAVGGRAADAENLGQEMQVQAIYLLDRAKRQGVGSALLRTLIRDFLAGGANSASVWMLRDNLPARRFYERHGAQFVTEKVQRFSGYDRALVGYIWLNLASAL